MSVSPIEVRRLRVSYPSARGPLEVLDHLELTIPRGSFTSLIGPSGCGKSTLLRILAGLQIAPEGTVELHGARTATVFQRPTLLPWRTVLDNALFGLACRRPPTGDDRAAATALLLELGLGDHLDAWPHTLSEGMAQRVNLARALLVRPDVLLMDEPFSALDVQSRRALHDDLLERWRTDALTVILVSHDLEEVAYLSDWIGVLSDKPTRLVDWIGLELPHPRRRGVQRRIALLEVMDRLAGALEQG